jgi:beta-glucosidase
MNPTPPTTHFPKGFHWGASAASYQVEGGIENTDWAQAAREGRVPPCGMACDHYHRYEEDFDLAKQLGHTAHRLSVEWARIEPEEGKFNDEAIAHYRKVLEALHVRGLTPMITLWHFTLPLWFSERGGFERSDSPEIFARYCTHVVEKLGDLCEHFSTMNEPIVFASNGWLRGSWPPFKRFTMTGLVRITNSNRQYESRADTGFHGLFLFMRVRKNLARAHNAAYRSMKAKRPALDVGLVKHIILFEGQGFFNRIKAWFANWQWTHVFMARTYQYCDSIGLNYYFFKKFGDTKVYDKTDMDWDVYPEGVHRALRMLSRYRKPLYVTEAGVADATDHIRADYITRQVEGVRRALAEGIDVRSHMYWSLLDNYEWALGFEKRFGLIEIDFATQKRTPRPSAYVYKGIIEREQGLLE